MASWQISACDNVYGRDAQLRVAQNDRCSKSSTCEMHDVMAWTGFCHPGGVFPALNPHVDIVRLERELVASYQTLFWLCSHFRSYYFLFIGANQILELRTDLFLVETKCQTRRIRASLLKQERHNPGGRSSNRGLLAELLQENVTNEVFMRKPEFVSKTE